MGAKGCRHHRRSIPYPPLESGPGNTEEASLPEGCIGRLFPPFAVLEVSDEKVDAGSDCCGDDEEEYDSYNC